MSIYTENNIGLLNRISAIFQRRHINIESINTSVSEIEEVSKFTIVVNLSEEKALAELLHGASLQGLVASAHDLSEGGLAQALVESSLRFGMGYKTL